MLGLEERNMQIFKIDYFILIFFSTLGSKINEFEWKKSEKNEKIPKT